MQTYDRKMLTTVLLACTTIAALPACNEKAPAPSTPPTTTNDTGMNDVTGTANDAQETANQAAQDASGFTSATIDVYKENARVGLDAINERIAAIRDNAAQLAGQAKADAEAAAQRIAEQRDAYLARLDEAQADTADAWAQVRTGLQQAWDDLEEASRAAADEFGG